MAQAVESLMWQQCIGKTKNPVAGRREGQSSCSVGDKEMYVFGGLLQDAEGLAEETNDLLRFEVKNGWSKIKCKGDVPPARSAAAMACVGRCLFLFGGLNQHDGWLNDLHVYDLETNVWKRVDTQGQGPSPRDKAAMTVVGDRIYLFGGFGPLAVLSDDDDDDDEEDDGDELETYEQAQKAAHFGWFNDLYVLDTASYTWSQPMQMSLGSPTPRAAMAMCTLGCEQLFIFGGRDAAGRCNDGYLFDTVTRKWTNLQQAQGSPPKPRSFHSATAFGDQAIVFGGRGSENEHYNDLFIYDSVSNQWSQLSPVGSVLPAARGCHSAGRIDSSLIVYGGSAHFNEELQHCLEYYDDTYLIDLSEDPYVYARGLFEASKSGELKVPKEDIDEHLRRTYGGSDAVNSLGEFL